MVGKTSKTLALPLLFSLGLLTACGGHETRSSSDDTTPAPAKVAAPHTQALVRNQHAHLEQDYAAMRASQISNVHYALSFELDKTSPNFEGSANIEFELAEGNKSDITVDFNGGEVKRLSLDGKDIKWDYNKWFITIPAAEVSAGKHILRIGYSRPYSTDGDGLHRYQDSETGRVYLYSNFEPYNANKMYPHFDQPNIKARYDLVVTAPTEWQVISATRESSVSEQEGIKIWRFPTTAPISSYIFPLHAGPYHVWEDTYESEDITIPLRLFAREELAQYVVLDDWFTPTKQSFGFFNDYFELPYPFGKYDQIIVPDFNAGAMENLAAVTFTERFVSRGKKVEAQRARLANVIAHEMAHMWFGDLVTMDWWNGLWLNESFATYMANLELAQASEFDSAWGTFYSRTKQWAYRTDEQVTTHPIELPVHTTADAFTNFDGITYGKGASVLKQLPYYLGEENFRKGVATYLKAHSYGNTELEDFIGALSQAAGKDLTEWTQQWLYEAGVNTLRTEFTCEGEQLKSITLIQTSPQDMDLPTLRSQRTQLGLYTVSEGQEAQQIAAIPVLYKGESTQVELTSNLACPDLIYPNLDDWAYVKVALDNTSSETLKQHILQFDDNNLRIMLWQSLWDGVHEHNISLDEFIAFATSKLTQEDSVRITNQVVSQLIHANNYYWVLDKTGKTYAQQRAKIADFLWQSIAQQAPGADVQKTYFDAWTSVASGKQHLNHMRNLITGKKSIEGLELDQDRRWNIIVNLNAYAFSDYLTLTKKEIHRDASDRGKLKALAANAARPGNSNKSKWFDQIIGIDGRYKLAEITEVMENLFPANQTELLEQYSDKLIQALPDLARAKDERFLARYSKALLPTTCTEASIAQLEKAIEKYSNLNPVLNKQLRISKQEDERCVAIGKQL